MLLPMTAEYILIKKYNSSQDVTEITETESNNSNKFLYSLSEIFLFSKILKYNFIQMMMLNIILVRS